MFNWKAANIPRGVSTPVPKTQVVFTPGWSSRVIFTTLSSMSWPCTQTHNLTDFPLYINYLRKYKDLKIKDFFLFTCLRETNVVEEVRIVPEKYILRYNFNDGNLILLKILPDLTISLHWKLPQESCWNQKLCFNRFLRFF